MASCEIGPAHNADAKLSRPVELTCFALIVANVVLLGTAFVQDLATPAATAGAYDFITAWSAGQMALAGHAAAAYDWPTFKLVEESVLGHPFDGYLGWPYLRLFVRRRLFGAVSIRDGLRFVGLRYVPGLSRRNPRHHRQSHRLFPRRRVPRNRREHYCRPERLPSAALIGGTLALMERNPVCAGACSDCSPTSRILEFYFRSRCWRAAAGGRSSAPASSRY